MDLFIILISIGIATRFEQLNNRIGFYKLKNISEFNWGRLRKDYVLLCELVEVVDENLSSIILLSCSNTLYFICFQLLNIFK